MFGFFRNMSQGAGVAVGYITVGVLTMIWTTIWYYWLRNHGRPSGDPMYYVCAGLFFSGLAVTLIGLLLGRIGRAAKKADNADVVPAAPAPAPAPPAPMPTMPATVVVAQPPAPAPMTAPAPMAAPPQMVPQPVSRIQPT